jgi:transposase InsO family protein
MNLPRSSYYYEPKANKPGEENLMNRIEEIVEEFSGYGYRRVTAQLHRDGISVNHKKVLRIMQERGITCKPRRRFVRTTDSNHSYRTYPNLLQDCPLTGINQVWIADITYIRILASFVYLAVILDLFSRKAIGYAISLNIDVSLSLKALKMAIQSRNQQEGIIHHSDQGVQYAANDYVDLLQSYGFRISMARKGNPYDNAVAESFIKTLKTEEVYLWEYQTLADVEKRLPYFIEQVYNQKRLHSSLGYRPPDEFEMLCTKTQNQNPCLVTLT